MIARLGDGAGELSPLEGLTPCERHGDTQVLEYAGDLPPLLAWLAAQPLADLRLEPLGLRGIYQRYHASEE